MQNVHLVSLQQWLERAWQVSHQTLHTTKLEMLRLPLVLTSAVYGDQM